MIFSSADAVARTQAAIDAQVAGLEKVVSDKINDAIKRGDSSVMVYLNSTSAAAQAAFRKILIAAGYTLTDQVGVDQRDYGYATISWLTNPAVPE